MKLLFDNNISPRVPRAINELLASGSQAVPLRARFAANTSDIDWIEAIGAEGGWSVVSGDLRITKNRAERAAWMQTDLIGFFMEPALLKLDPLQQTSRLLL